MQPTWNPSWVHLSLSAKLDQIGREREDVITRHGITLCQSTVLLSIAFRQNPKKTAVYRCAANFASLLWFWCFTYVIGLARSTKLASACVRLAHNICRLLHCTLAPADSVSRHRLQHFFIYWPLLPLFLLSRRTELQTSLKSGIFSQPVDTIQGEGFQQSPGIIWIHVKRGLSFSKLCK